MHRPRYDDADKGRADQRTDHRSHVQSDIVVARAKIDKVAGTNGDDASYGHHPEQPARDIEDHRKSYGRYGGRYGEFEIGVMRRHAQILHEVVDPADVDGQRDAERHGDHDEQCIDGPCDTHLHVVIQHVAYKINQRDAGDDEKSAGAAENIVAIDGIAVVADPANKVEDLTKDQLVSIYTGETKNWSEVGGDDQAIVVVGREAGSGTRGAFEELLDIADACVYANELDSTGAVMAKVASTPGAIGYVSLDVVDDSVKALKLDGVDATEENIKAGNYALSRPFVMATKGEISEQKTEVQALFDYLSSDEGKALIKSVGLITVD